MENKTYLVTFIYQVTIEEAANQFHAVQFAQEQLATTTLEDLTSSLVVERVEVIEDDDDDSE